MQSSPSASEVWASTNIMTSMATRLVGAERYLGREERNLGTQVGPHAYELFSICAPGEALQLHFQQQQPTFIAVHDVGAVTSAAFLRELGAALQQPVQTLTIRQQGTGVTMSVLRFIELPSLRGNALRVYATSVEADTVTRKQVAEALLAFSRLGVLLVEALPDHMLAAQFATLRDRLLSVPWSNHELLLVPRASLPSLQDHAQRLVDGTFVQAHSAGPAVQTAAIWNAIHGAWSRLRHGPATQTAAPAPAPQVAPQRAPQSAVPPAAAPVPSSGASLLLRAFGAPPKPAEPTRPAVAAPAAPNPGVDAYARACSVLHGALNCVVFDRASRRPLAQSGREPASAAMIGHIAASLDAAQAMNAAWGNRSEAVETVCSLERHVVVCRTLARRPGVGMAIAFDKAQANLMLLRAQLQRLDAMLDQ